MWNGLERDKAVISRGKAYTRSASYSITLYVTVFTLLSTKQGTEAYSDLLTGLKSLGLSRIPRRWPSELQRASLQPMSEMLSWLTTLAARRGLDRLVLFLYEETGLLDSWRF
jgi:hypothetical protein